MINMKLIPLVLFYISVVQSSDDVHIMEQNTKVENKNETPVSVPVTIVYEESNRNNRTIDIGKSDTTSDPNVQNNKNQLNKNTLTDLKVKPNFNESDIKEDSSTKFVQNVEEQVNQKLLDISVSKIDDKLSNVKDTINSGKDGKVENKDMKRIPSSDVVSDIPVVVIYDPLPEKFSTPEDKNLMSDKLTNKEKEPQNMNEKPNNKYVAEKQHDQSIVNGIINEKVTNNSMMIGSAIDIDDTNNKKSMIRSRTQPKNPADPEIAQNRRQQRKQNYNVKQNNLNESQDIKSRSKTKVENKSTEVATKTRKRTRERDPVVPIIQSESYVYSDRGDFHYSYESGDGTKAFERGQLRTIDDNAGEAVVGSFSYIGKDGNDYSLTYTADENGYRPVGAHLPTPPPIPPAIARALKYLATKTTPEPVTEPTK